MRQLILIKNIIYKFDHRVIILNKMKKFVQKLEIKVRLRIRMNDSCFLLLFDEVPVSSLRAKEFIAGDITRALIPTFDVGRYRYIAYKEQLSLE